MEKVIELGKNKYTYKINFKLSYDFLKYRNRITKGFDFSSADKKVVSEIVDMQNKVLELEKAGEEYNELDFIKKLSPEALEFLQNNSNKNTDIFSYEEIIDIVSKLTGLTDETAINKVLDEEIEESNMDNLVGKLIGAISEVFTNAKDNSVQEKN